MAEADSILRRKAGSGQRPDITQMSPEKAMKLAFGRTGRSVSGLGLRMTGFSMTRSSIASLVAAAGEGAMVLTLTRAGVAGGMIFVEAGMTAALIEAETMGRLGRGEAEHRAPTRIDALIVSGFLESALSAFDDLAEELSIGPAVTGWRPGDMLSSAMLLPLMLEDVPLRLFRLGFEFGEGARQGGLSLAMPMEPSTERRSGGESFGPGLRDAVLLARASVRAVLAQLPLPLHEVTGWEPGSLVPLPRELLARVRIEDIDGVTVARGRLGQVNGARAVRILTPGAPD